MSCPELLEQPINERKQRPRLPHSGDPSGTRTRSRPVAACSDAHTCRPRGRDHLQRPASSMVCKQGRGEQDNSQEPRMASWAWMLCEASQRGHFTIPIAPHVHCSSNWSCVPRMGAVSRVPQRRSQGQCWPHAARGLSDSSTRSRLSKSNLLHASPTKVKQRQSFEKEAS